MKLCAICGKEARGFGAFDSSYRYNDVERFKNTTSFCSRECMELFSKQRKTQDKKMIDFNHKPNFQEQLNNLIDKALANQQSKQPPRHYLGASRLGVACTRALQFELTNTPKDEDKHFDGKTLRIFEAGHVFETLAIRWLRLAGFTLHTEQADGTQYGFSAANGQLQGHVDGIITNAPEPLHINGFPMLWECKSLNDKSWRDTVKKGLTLSKPIYAAQIALYQAYMEESIAGISQHSALFTAINKNTAEFYHELIPFDCALAQKMSDKAVNILRATESEELLPPISKDPDFVDCKFCAWTNRCQQFNLSLKRD